MTKIEVLKQFQDDGQTFYVGEERYVSREKAGYYCGSGWARASDGKISAGAPAAGEVTLSINNGRLGQSASTME